MSLTVSEYRVNNGVLQARLSNGTWFDVNPALELTIGDAPAAPQIDAVRYLEGLITASGAGTYTVAFAIPAGAVLRDLSIVPEAAWDSATSATLNAGDVADTDAYFAAVDMKAQTTYLSNLLGSTGVGTSGGEEVGYPNGGTVSVVIVAVGAGSAGRTRVRLYYALASSVAAAVKS